MWEHDYHLAGRRICRTKQLCSSELKFTNSTVCGCAIDARSSGSEFAWFKCHRQLRLELYSAAALKKRNGPARQKVGAGPVVDRPRLHQAPLNYGSPVPEPGLPCRLPLLSQCGVRSGADRSVVRLGETVGLRRTCVPVTHAALPHASLNHPTATQQALRC